MNFKYFKFTEDQKAHLKALTEYSKIILRDDSFFKEPYKSFEHSAQKFQIHHKLGIIPDSSSTLVRCIQMDSSRTVSFFEQIVRGGENVTFFYSLGSLENDVEEDSIDLTPFYDYINSIQDVLKTYGRENNINEDEVTICFEIYYFPKNRYKFLLGNERQGSIFNLMASTNSIMYYEPHEEFKLFNAGVLSFGDERFYTYNDIIKDGIVVVGIFVEQLISEDELEERKKDKSKTRDNNVTYRPPWGRPKYNEEMTDDKQKTRETKKTQSKRPNIEIVDRGRDAQWGVDKFSIRPTKNKK